MTDTHGASGVDHSTHDLHLIAAAADRDADELTRTAAERQIASCDECAALFADLHAISSGLGSLPRSLPVTRDFRISPQQAARLRSGGWRRFLEGFSRAPSLRPLASALTTLGVAGLLLTVALPNAERLLPVAGGTPAAAPEVLSGQGAPGASAAPAGQGPAGGGDTKSTNAAGSPPPGYGASEQATSPAPAGSPAPVANEPGTTDARTAYGGAGSSPGATALDTRASRPVTPTAPLSPSALLPWASLALVVIGIGLLLIARLGARGPAG
jgi:hypothetical protein